MSIHNTSFFLTIQKQKKTHEAAKMLNFYMVGMDSTSRQNYMRFLPKTYSFLSNHSSVIGFEGYNKVGLNTDPNLSALLMGINPTEFLDYYSHSCYKNRWQSLDGCPLIWKNFSEKGYVTFYAEDYSKVSLYHNNRVGFVHQPTAC